MQTFTKFWHLASATNKSVTFERNIIGWIITIITLLTAVNSMFFFLGQLKVGVVGWVMLNTCAPSIFLFALGFLLKSPTIMVAASVLMFRYGTLGLFVFGWQGIGNIMAQIGHITMTVSVIYTVIVVIQQKLWGPLAAGIGLGLIILIPLMIVQAKWFEANPEMFEKLFSGSLEPPK